MPRAANRGRGGLPTAPRGVRGEAGGKSSVDSLKQQRQKIYEAAMEDTKRLMYAAGDVVPEKQLPETVSAVMAATQQYMRELTVRLAQRHLTRSQIVMQRSSITRDTDGLLFLLHRDRRAYERLTYLLERSAEIDKARSMQSISQMALLGAEPSDKDSNNDDA